MRSWRVAPVVAIVLLAGASAWADTQSAREHFERGTAAYALGKFADAAQEYETAFQLKPDPALLYNAAQAHRQAGNKTRALFLYRNYLRLYGASAGNRDEVKRISAELQRAIDSEQRAAGVPPTETQPIPPERLGPRSSAEPVVPEPARREPAPQEPAPPPTANPSPPSSKPAPATNNRLVAAPPAEKPLVKKGWFWGVIGGGVVVVAAAVALGVVFGTPAQPPSPSLGAIWAN